MHILNKIKCKQYHIVQKDEDLDHMFTILQNQEMVAFDTETTFARPLSKKIVGLSFATTNNAWYIPINHARSLVDVLINIKIDKIINKFQNFLQTWKGILVAHNIAFDIYILSLCNISLKNWTIKIADTMIAVALLGDTYTKGLEKQIYKRYNYKMQKLKNMMTACNVGQPSFIPISELAHYACDDAWWTLRLASDILLELDQKKLSKVFWDLEMKVVPVVISMYLTGIRLDIDFLKKISCEMNLLEQQLKIDWYNLVPDCSINSPVQISQNLIEPRGGFWLKKGSSRGKNGHYSTKNKVINWQIKNATKKEGRETAEILLRYRQISALRKDFAEKLVLLADHDDRLRPNQNQVGTVTGRFSSSNPNCQNIHRPTKAIWPHEKGSLPPIRKAFIASKGWKLLDIDYSQIELRMITHLSQDKVMLKVYKQLCDCVGGGYWEKSDKYKMIQGNSSCKKCKGLGFSGDIHQTTADNTGATRQNAKAINFGLIYGESPYTLADQINCSIDEAKKFHKRYFDTYTGIRQWHQNSVIRAKKTDGIVKTLTGRIRYITTINSPERKLNNAAQRLVWNTHCQGSAADLIKIAMRNLYNYWKEKNLLHTHCRLLMMVHDELLCEVREELVEEQMLVIKKIMESVANLSIPLLADPHYGDTWMDAH